MKKNKTKALRSPIEAAGGIVMRGRVRPLFAVVQLRRQKTWVLPKGKLNRNETALAAARREAIEETGHDVEVGEFLGSLVYTSSGRPKTVRFWRMQASRRPVAKLMDDVRAVLWLPLAKATTKLTHEREKLFLDKVGRQLMRQNGPWKRKSPKSATGAGRKAKAAAKRASVGTAGSARRPYPRGHAQRGEEPAPRSTEAAPFQIQSATRRPPPAIRTLWRLLRR